MTTLAREENDSLARAAFSALFRSFSQTIFRAYILEGYYTGIRS